MTMKSAPLTGGQSQASTPPFQKPISDEIFHLAPLSTLDQHTISPLYYPNSTPGPRPQAHPITCEHSIQSKAQDDSRPLGASEDDSSYDDSFHHLDNLCEQEYKDIRHTIPCPRNSREAYLLLEAARADRRIIDARKTLALQIIHRNTLVLQYNRMVLEQAQDDLQAADRFVGQVRFWIRKSGQSAAFEYAMHEDHSQSMSTSSAEQLAMPPLFDVDLT